MALDPLSVNSKIAVYNNDVSLTDKTAAPKSQGVTVADLSGFIKVDAAVPDSATGLKGDFSFSTVANKLEVCISSFGSIFPGRVIPALTAPTNATTGAYTGIVPTGGSGTGLIVTIVMSNNDVTSITSTTAGSGYKSTDVLTIPAQVVGGSSTTFTASPTIGAIAAEYLAVTLT